MLSHCFGKRAFSCAITVQQLLEAEKALDRQALIERAMENIEKIKVSYHDEPLL